MKRALILAFVSTSAIASTNYTQDARDLSAAALCGATNTTCQTGYKTGATVTAASKRLETTYKAIRAAEVPPPPPPPPPPLPLFAQLYRAWGKYSATVREANIRLDRLGAKPFIYKAPPQIEAAKATVLAMRTCRNPKCPATVTINDAIKALTLETGSIQSLLPAPPK